MNPLRILIADDHGIVRQGLRLILEQRPQYEVVGEATDGREAVALATELKPDIIIMDIAMRHLNGLDATAQILEHLPETKVIVLSMYAEEGYLLRALSAGVRAYLLKDNAEADLFRALEVVQSGKPFFSPAISELLVEDYIRALKERGLSDSYDLLSPREKEVLQLLAEGQTNKEVAAVLGLSPHTVDTHRANLMQKLNLKNLADLIIYAVRKKLIH
jgi:two-component system, NarL family, response regulator NreC